MAVNNIHSNERLGQGLPGPQLHMLGEPTVAAEMRSPASEFTPKTPQELLDLIIDLSPLNGFDIDSLSYADQANFTHGVHAVINGYHTEQHRSEWAAGTNQAIAPPLPYQWVKSRLDTYYTEVFKGDGDKSHEQTVKTLRKTHLPTAIEMSVALPEIATAIEIQALLDNHDKDIAADGVGDLLVVYGITIYYLREKQAQLRKEHAEKAARAGQALGKML